MNKIKWGIIGCGNVCEVKSGPAFNKVGNSEIVAVMRRDLKKAREYALKNNVAEYYNNATDILNHNNINAIYISTPPWLHMNYAIEAMKHGKMVYVEKPVALNTSECNKMLDASVHFKVKCSVAHYRRALPMFIKIRETIINNEIGKIRSVNISLFQRKQNNLIASTEQNWRLTPKISGGGLFHDLAPHQLDILLWIFGKPDKVNGISFNHTKIYEAQDFVNLSAVFQDSIMFNGTWIFNHSNDEDIEKCEIFGENGSIEFSFFRNNSLQLKSKVKKESMDFIIPIHIQQPMIEKVVNYFLGKDSNPCSLKEARESMIMMDSTL